MGCHTELADTERTLWKRIGLGILFGIVGVFLITTNLDFQMLGQGAVIGDLARARNVGDLHNPAAPNIVPPFFNQFNFPIAD